MSEEIVFADMLNHYSLKTSEISDMLGVTVSYLNKCVAVSRDSWQSLASDKFILQIANTEQYIRRADAAVSELMRIFNVVKNNELDSKIGNLEAEIHAEQNNSFFKEN